MAEATRSTMFKAFLFGAALGLASTSALPEAKLTLVERGSPTLSAPRQLCSNSPADRSCWDPANNFSINTDPETSWPTTNVKTVPYTLVVTQENFAPDGTSLPMLLINGTYPGPTLVANWGDTLEITVINNMVDNGTSIHWHGISQKGSSISDGANGVTECPIPPGSSRVYTFICNEHGTTWYHSHHSAQYASGVVGTILINGPASANYDLDLGTLPLTDFYYKTYWQEARTAGIGAPPQADNALINGTNKNVAGTAGSYNLTPLTKGLKHRLRLVNTAVDAGFYVSLDSHPFQVIEADFVPIKPYNANWLFLAIGQRYDVIIDANQTAGNYWFRATTAAGCGNNKNTAIRSIFTYNGTTVANPTSTAFTQTLTACADELSSNIQPVVTKAVDNSTFILSTGDTLPVKNAGQISGVFSWQINNSAINVDWEHPTLAYVEEQNTTYASSLNILQLPNANQWSYWVIQNTGGVAHPIHLHGHDFFLLGAGSGTFTASTVLNWASPPRRDVALLPASGYLVIAFITDNPGAWLMHCHIAWHVGEGLAVQFLERASEISTTMNLKQIQPACNDWDKWYAKSTYKKDDSGL